MNRSSIAAMLCVIGLAGFCGSARAGNLDPPGPPGSTMKTLKEVEPRTAIRAADLPLTIPASGSYYLAGNVSTSGAGITVAASDVTIDLMGYTFSGGTGDGIGATITLQNVSVLNGTIAGWSGSGVNLDTVEGARVIDVVAESNGSRGIRVGARAVVRDCVARDNAIYGILTSTDALVTGCTVTGTLSFWGVTVSQNSLVIDCLVSGNKFGLMAAGATVRGCTVSSNTDTGIQLSTTDGGASGNTVVGNGGVGILVSGQRNLIDGNSVSLNVGGGIEVTGTFNSIVRNFATANTAFEYSIAGGNDAGPIGTAAASTSPWANLED